MLQPSLREADGSYGSSALPDAFKVRTAQLSEGANGDSARKIFRVVLAEKVLELVQQEVEMTVYANPEPSGADEWVIRGEIWEIGSPQLESSWGPTTVGGG